MSRSERQSQEETRPLLPAQHTTDLVDLSDVDHPLHPFNLAQWRKWCCFSILGAMTFVGSFASAAFNAAIPITAEEFGTSTSTMALGTSLFIFGFAAGPVVVGPASEVYGRKVPFFIGYFLFILSQVPVALGQDARTVLIFRFIGGATSAVCPAIAGGWLADFLRPAERGIAVAVFAGTTLIGPEIGAISSQILVQSSLGWRWIPWITMLLGAISGTAGFFILPETYLPVLEQQYAWRIRRETKRWALHSRLDETPVSVYHFATRYLTRPLAMLLTEPILFFMTAYITFTFGLVYLLFVAYPVSFKQERGLSAVASTLPLLSVCCGVVIGGFYASWYSLTIYKRKAAQAETTPLLPEDRLPPMIVGAISLAVGLFWFAWTSTPSLDLRPQILAGVPIGFGVQVLLLQALAYLIDIYTTQAASAISGTMIVRSLVGGTFPLFAIQLYEALGVFWATNLLGVCALILAPIPVVFYTFGAELRSAGKYSK